MIRDIKTIGKHSIIYGSGVVLSKLIGFVMIPIYTRYLTPADYGILELVYRTSGIATILIIMGLQNAVMREYAGYQDTKQQNEVVSTGLIFLMTMSMAAIITLVGCAGPLSQLIFNSSENGFYFRLAFFASYFEICLVIPFAYLRIKDRSVFYTLMSVFRLSIALSLNIYFVVFLRYGVKGILLSEIISAGLSSIFILIVIFRNVKFKFNPTKLKELLLFGLPLVPAGIPIQILHNSDRFFLQYFTSEHEVGLYSLGYKFGIVLGVIINNPFGLVWQAHMYTIMKRDNAREVYGRVLTYYMYVTLFFALCLSMPIKEIIQIMAAEIFWDAYKVVPLILLSYAIFGIYGIVNVPFFIEKKTMKLPLITLSAALCNLILNWFSIKYFGMMGAAIATVLSFSILSLLVYRKSRKFYPIPYEYGRLIKLFSTAIILYFMSFLIEIDNICLTIIFKMMLAFTFPIILYFIKFYSNAEIRKINELGVKIKTMLYKIALS